MRSLLAQMILGLGVSPDVFLCRIAARERIAGRCDVRTDPYPVHCPDNPLVLDETG
jgi:hypothetical protein